MAEYKGIVFDLDGTLVHSKVNFRKMKSRMITKLEENGIPTRRLFPTMTTVEILGIAENIWEEQKLPEKKRERLRGLMEQYMNEVELEAVENLIGFNGVKETIERLYNMGYKLAILTRSHKEYALKSLEKIKILHFFELILGRGDTPKPKPNPEALLYAAEKLNLNIKDILFVGDHHIDSTCAFNANCPFIGVNTGHKGRDSWTVNEPEIVLNSIIDLPQFLEK
jgi:HAD superfamily hydrolase (TIGR01549 family)